MIDTPYSATHTTSPDSSEIQGERLQLNDILAELGGVLTHEHLGGIQRSVNDLITEILAVEQHNATDSAPRLNLSWVRNWDANALAFEVDAVPHIAIFGGTATLTAAVCLAIARSSEYIPSIAGGESDAESFAAVAACFARRWPEHADDPVPSAEQLFRDPSSDERRQIASDLVWVCTSLLVLHEAGHHRHGHVKTLSRQFGLWGMSESNRQPITSGALGADAFGLSHAMEVQADTMAIRATLAILADVATSTAPRDAVVMQSLRDMIIALGILCCVFDYDQLPIAGYQSKQHPHPAVRLTYGIREAVDWALSKHFSEDNIRDAVLSGIADLRWLSTHFDWTLTQVIDEHGYEIDQECRRLRSVCETVLVQS